MFRRDRVDAIERRDRTMFERRDRTTRSNTSNEATEAIEAIEANDAIEAIEAIKDVVHVIYVVVADQVHVTKFSNSTNVALTTWRHVRQFKFFKSELIFTICLIISLKLVSERF